MVMMISGGGERERNASHISSLRLYLPFPLPTSLPPFGLPFPPSEFLSRSITTSLASYVTPSPDDILRSPPSNTHSLPQPETPVTRELLLPELSLPTIKYVPPTFLLATVEAVGHCPET